MTPVSENSAGRRQWLGLIVLALGLAMIVLDGTIVGVALPTIITGLDLDLTDAQWVNALYSVVFAALLLSAGSLGDRWGRRRLFMLGVVVFVAGSALAGASQDASALIAARAVQGLGGAMVLPSSLSTVNATFRGRDRAVAFGVWGAVMAGAAAVGPLLGGWLTSSFGWRAIFVVNLPVGLLVVVGALLLVDETRGGPRRRGLDVDGLLTSALGFGLMVFGLIEGDSLGWWAPKGEFSAFGLVWPAGAAVSVVPVAIAVGAGFVATFVVWERHRARVERDALLDLELFGVPTFSWGNITAMTVAAGEFAVLFALPLYLMNVLGLSVMGAGWVLAAMALGAFASGTSARHLSARLGPPTVVVVGLGLEVIGAGATALLIGPTTAPALVGALLVVYGVGLGLASAQLTSTVLADIPPASSGAASATQSTVRQLGSALGTAVAGTVLAAQLGAALTARVAAVPGLDATTAAQLVATLRDSAGSSLVALRAQGATGQLGAAGPQVTALLEQGFAQAVSWAIAVAVAAMVLGLIGALRVRAVAARRPAAVPPVVTAAPGSAARDDRRCRAAQ
ncbi:MAG: MFS transporter [Cellulomonas sp.]|nr:MFS transporter [Cellulomonas sp.]